MLAVAGCAVFTPPSSTAAREAAPGYPVRVGRVFRDRDDGFVHTNPGDAFPANPFGLHDMLGNVWEWTADCFVPDHRHAPSDASAEITAGDCSRRTIRGGSWHNSPDSLRSAARFWLPPRCAQHRRREKHRRTRDDRSAS